MSVTKTVLGRASKELVPCWELMSTAQLFRHLIHGLNQASQVVDAALKNTIQAQELKSLIGVGVVGRHAEEAADIFFQGLSRKA
jgi:hypothetical protein